MCVDEINAIYQDFKEVTNFVAVYITEAHAKDVWPIGDKVCVYAHKNIEDRLKVANGFVNDYKFQIPMLVDEMSNDFDHIYSAWPERFYIFHQGSLQFIGEPNSEWGFTRAFLRKAIINNSPRKPVVNSPDAIGNA